MFGKKVDFKVWEQYVGYKSPVKIIEDDIQVLEYENSSNNENPSFSHDGDSGFDIRAWIKSDEDGVKLDKETNVPTITLKPLERRMIHTGLRFKLPEHTEIQCRPRSGYAYKEGLTVINTPGTIDENYRGELCVVVINLSNKKITIKSGERIAQAVLCPVYNSYLVNMARVEDINNNTSRGADAFGSSGKV